jgi:hypothetical protein
MSTERRGNFNLICDAGEIIGRVLAAGLERRYLENLGARYRLAHFWAKRFWW